ncbi:hypothetical protein [Cupriavidus sp. BIS7]|uniref:hypothetical protein n=1 Tax=Cupriavidus sp. BIS7 TaxID=1217718 RepID=UPI0002DD3A93|nr:hypothetical protein [Cupriavidus sp. BIS7]
MAETGQFETFDTTAWIVDDRRVGIDGNFCGRQYVFMNYDALNSMMCTMTANGESWEL